MDILPCFSEDFPNSTSLELPITVINVTANLPPEFISFHKLKSISFMLIQVGNIFTFTSEVHGLSLSKLGPGSINSGLLCRCGKCDQGLLDSSFIRKVSNVRFVEVEGV